MSQCLCLILDSGFQLQPPTDVTQVAGFLPPTRKAWIEFPHSAAAPMAWDCFQPLGSKSADEYSSSISASQMKSVHAEMVLGKQATSLWLLLTGPENNIVTIVLTIRLTASIFYKHTEDAGGTGKYGSRDCAHLLLWEWGIDSLCLPSTMRINHRHSICAHIPPWKQRGLNPWLVHSYPLACLCSHLISGV